MKKREMERKLKEAGCRLLRQGANHEVWVSAEGKRIYLPRHKAQEIPKGTAESILREAGL